MTGVLRPLVTPHAKLYSDISLLKGQADKTYQSISGGAHFLYPETEFIKLVYCEIIQCKCSYCSVKARNIES